MADKSQNVTFLSCTSHVCCMFIGFDNNQLFDVHTHNICSFFLTFGQFGITTHHVSCLPLKSNHISLSIQPQLDKWKRKCIFYRHVLFLNTFELMIQFIDFVKINVLFLTELVNHLYFLRFSFPSMITFSRRTTPAVW